MNSAPLPRRDELLADRATQGLSREEMAELAAILAAEGDQDDVSLDFAAAALDLAMAGSEQELPAALQDKLIAAGERFGGGVMPQTRRSTSVLGRIGWLAAAAGFALAGWAMWGRGPSAPLVAPSPLAARAELLAHADDAVTIPWTDFVSLDEAKLPPEITGIKGDVVWSDRKQEGYLRLVGMKPNDPRVEQYQLWIVDAQRGLSQRISGGVFDVASGGEVVVPIAKPAIAVNKAAAFAVTIEKPGGTWVSEMTRRACLAMRGS